jgi:flagellar basal-body rod protein FlgF
MDTSTYVALSGQLALDRRLQTIANNVANAATVGFRAEGVHFESLLSAVSPIPTAFTSEGTSHVSAIHGGLRRTDGLLDVALQGEGFIGIQTPQGRAYTRDGRMQMLPTGELVSVNGHAILDAGGAPLQLDPRGGPPSIARDGMVTQDDRQLGAVGLFEVDLTRSYSRFENSAFIPGATPQPVLSFDGNGMVQGFVEESNVNPVMQMAELIQVTRAFEHLGTTLDEVNSSQKAALQVLAGRG